LNKHIDLNCDLGEGMPNDEALMKLITSANIACGAHAGDEATMRHTVELANRHNVAIGAHPGFPDKPNFGRLELPLSENQIESLVRIQIEKLTAITKITHVKPHGALYNMAARDERIAQAIARAIHAVDPRLTLVGLTGSAMIRAAHQLNLPAANEVFADRTYQPDGSLTPRSRPDALIKTPLQCVDQVLRMVQHGTVSATDGSTIPVQADTICLHGDGEHAIAFATLLRSALQSAGIEIRHF